MKLKKKLVLLTLAISMVLVGSFNIAEAKNPEKDIKIWINDFYIMSDVHPFIDNGRTIAPIRFIAEELGYKVDWYGETETVSIKKDDNKIIFKIGSNEVTINGEKTYLDEAARLIEERIFVPFRSIAELLGEKVDYNSEYKVAIIGDQFDADNYYPLKYYLESKAPFITNLKINFVESTIRHSDGRVYNLETYKEVLKLVDKEGKDHEELGFVTEVEKDKQLYDKYYISPIEYDPLVGSWYGTGGIVDSDEYKDAYTYIEKIEDNKYLFIKRWVKPDGSELIIESYASYNTDKGILFKERSHKTIKATGNYSYKDTHIYQELKAEKFDYMYDLDNSKIFSRKF